jgi:methylenetetrahydrofolate--tRNA-(uracil-5-)-methyltransferase
VGFQTKLKVGEQKRVFRMLPGLERAEFVRFGMLHRNTYINGPAHLDSVFRWKRNPRVFFAGQLTGVEGYLESAATGLMVGSSLAQLLEGREPKALPFSTALGSLAKHVSSPRAQEYTPMNVTFGLIEDEDAPGVPPIRDRAKRREEIGRRALLAVLRWREEALPARVLHPS